MSQQGLSPNGGVSLTTAKPTEKGKADNLVMGAMALKDGDLPRVKAAADSQGKCKDDKGNYTSGCDEQKDGYFDHARGPDVQAVSGGLSKGGHPPVDRVGAILGAAQ